MRRITAVGLCLILVLLSLIPGCGDDKPSGLILGDFAYPLQVGQIWKYSGSSSWYNFRPESTAYLDYSTSFISMVQVIRKTRLLDTLDVYNLKETIIEIGRDTSQSWNYFNNRPTGLYSFGHGGSGNSRMQPRKITPAQHQLMFRGKPLADIMSALGSSLLGPSGKASPFDSITRIEDPPVRCLKYPLTAGSEWVVRPPQEPFAISKKAIGRVKIQVPAGLYICAQIRWMYDLEPDGSWDADIEMNDYISEIGLVKRTTLFRNVTIMTPEYPLGIGTYDIAEVWELTQTQSGE